MLQYFFLSLLALNVAVWAQQTANLTEDKTECVDYNAEICKSVVQNSTVKGIYCQSNYFLDGKPIPTSCCVSCRSYSGVEVTNTEIKEIAEGDDPMKFRKNQINRNGKWFSTSQYISEFGCYDYNSLTCPQFASQGKCSSTNYIGFMPVNIYCCVSCRTSVPAPAPVPQPNICVDRDYRCQTYSTQGYCNLNIYVESMLISQYCCASCRSYYPPLPPKPHPWPAPPRPQPYPHPPYPIPPPPPRPNCVDFDAETCKYWSSYLNGAYCYNQNAFINNTRVYSACPYSCGCLLYGCGRC